VPDDPALGDLVSKAQAVVEAFKKEVLGVLGKP